MNKEGYLPAHWPAVIAGTPSGTGSPVPQATAWLDLAEGERP